MKDFNIDNLLKPYREAGIETSKVRRTLSTLATALIIKHKIPADIAGAAIFDVFYRIAFDGLEFKGDGSYGSKGDELFQCIKAQALAYVAGHSRDAVLKEIREVTACVEKDCPARTRIFPRKSFWARVGRWAIRSRGWWGV